MKKTTGIIIFLCIVIAALIIFIFSTRNFTSKKFENVKEENQNEVIKNTEKIDEKVTTQKDKDEEVIKSVLDDIEKKVDFNSITKSTNGDITKEKLTTGEFKNKKQEYISKLKTKMELFNIYEEDGNNYVEYDMSSILKELGYSAHQGTGIKPGVQVVNINGANKMSKRGIISKVLDDIEKNNNFENITKSLDGDITAEKLSIREFIESKNEYIDKLQDKTELFKIYEENENQYVEYEVSSVLKALGYSAHQGVGIKHGTQKLKI